MVNDRARPPFLRFITFSAADILTLKNINEGTLVEIAFPATRVLAD